jgi:hypothetical protein
VNSETAESIDPFLHVKSGACNHLIGILCGRATAFCSSRTLSALDCTAIASATWRRRPATTSFSGLPD